MYDLWISFSSFIEYKGYGHEGLQQKPPRNSQKLGSLNAHNPGGYHGSITDGINQYNP
jgi:hypothetical protein